MTDHGLRHRTSSRNERRADSDPGAEGPDLPGLPWAPWEAFGPPGAEALLAMLQPGPSARPVARRPAEGPAQRAPEAAAPGLPEAPEAAAPGLPETPKAAAAPHDPSLPDPFPAPPDVPPVAPAPPLGTVAIDPDVDPAALPDGGIGVALGDTFRLHSLPGSTLTIHLDFDGHVATGTPWSEVWNQADIVSPAFSLDGSAGFGAAELLAIQRIWQQVAELFSPFNINVTTEAPDPADLTLEGFEDTAHGIRVVITDEADKPYGGIAWTGSFNYAVDTPAYVYANQLGDQVQAIVVAAAHEAGHALGLGHDGRGQEEYYWGHGSGAAAWAPIMGVGYDAAIVQWSRGQYKSASNAEDDLAIITSRNFGVDWRADEAGSTRATAAPLAASVGTDGVALVRQYGIISGSGAVNDIDRYAFTLAAGGTVALQVSAWGAAHVGGSAVPVYSPLPLGMLDAKLTLYRGNSVVAVFDDPARQDGIISLSGLAGGSYSLAIDGTGWGAPRDAAPSGWSEYGSLGQYMITGSYTAAPAAPLVTGILDDSAPGTGPVAPGGTTNDETPTLSGQAGAGETISLRRDGALLGTAIADAAGGWTLTSTALGQGAQALSVTATDAAGLVSAATPVLLVVDGIAPAAPVIDRAESAAGGGLDLAGRAEPGSLVTLLDGGVAIGSATADAAGAWSWAGFPLAGSYSLAATATDAAGNVSAPSQTLAGPIGLRLDQAAISLAEAGGAAALVLRVVGMTDPAASLTVSLSGLDPTEASASATEVVLDAARGWAATILLAGRDDDDADGPRAQALTVSAPGLGSIAATVTTLDDELAAATYTRVGIGAIDMAAFAAADGVALTIAEKRNGAGSHVIDQRWGFDLPAPGDAMLHLKASATEPMRLQQSRDGGASWEGLVADGAPVGPATLWDGAWRIAGVTEGLIIRLVDIRGAEDLVADSVSVDLLTVTPLPADAAALAPLG